MPPPNAVSSCKAIGCDGTRIAIVSWPPVSSSETSGWRRMTSVSGPGQKRSASISTLAEMSVAQRGR